MNTQLVRSEFKMLYITIMNIELKAAYMKMLQKMMNIETQLIRYMPKMADNATDPVLSDVIAKYTRDITIQRDRIRRILLKHRMPSHVEQNIVFDKFLTDMEHDMLRISDESVRDSFIISTAQMIKHIRVSKYNTLVEWADFLRERDDQELLETTLQEEERIDQELAALARQNMFSVKDMRDMMIQN